MNVAPLLLLVSSFTENMPRKITEMAAHIANTEFQYRATTSVVWGQADFDLVSNFLSAYQGSVNIFDMKDNNNTTIALDQAVLFVSSDDEFLRFVANLDKNITKPSKVVTILTNGELSNITKAAWEYDITDLIILILNENLSVDMYSYYPYSNDICGNTTPLKVELHESFFPRKFKNFFGCETRVGTVQAAPYVKLDCVNGSSAFVKGLNGDLLMMMVAHLNTTVKVSCGENRDLQTIEYLKEKRIHVYMPVIFSSEFLATQFTTVYHFFESVWCGPPQREIYVWAKVIIPMMNNITILLFATYSTLVIVLKIINNIEPMNNKKSFHLAWKTFAIILGQTGDYESKSLLINFLFVLWVWFTLVITIAYQGVLVKGLQTKHLEPRFDTIENAVKLVDGYGGSKRQSTLYDGTAVGENFKAMNIPEMFTYLTPISRGRRYLILTTRLILLGYNNLQILEQAVNHLPMTVVMTPRWGAFAEVSSSQTRLVEGGFFEKLLQDEKLAVERREAKYKSESSGTKTGHLDFVTLSTCFYGLAVMGLVCFVVLLMEIVYHRFTTPSFEGTFQTRCLEKAHVA